MTRISGWCNGHDGCTSERAHDTCGERLTKGLLASCDCPQFGGHVNAESLSTTALSDPSGGQNNGV